MNYIEIQSKQIENLDVKASCGHIELNGCVSKCLQEKNGMMWNLAFEIVFLEIQAYLLPMVTFLPKVCFCVLTTWTMLLTKEIQQKVAGSLWQNVRFANNFWISAA